MAALDFTGNTEEFKKLLNSVAWVNSSIFHHASTMRVTPYIIDQISAGLKDKGIRRGELAEAVGLGPSWVTNLLKGDLRTLRDEHRFTIERLLGIELEEGVEDLAGRKLSPDAYRVADLVERNNEAAEWGRLMLKIFRNPESITSCIFPALTREEATAIGQAVVAEANRASDEAYLGAWVIQHLETFLAAILEEQRPTSPVRKSLWLEHRGGVSAGSYPKPLRSRQWKMDSSIPYGSDHYLLRAFGGAMEPSIPDGSDILVRPFRGGWDELDGIFIIRSRHGRRLAQYFRYHGNTEESPENDGLVDMFTSRSRQSEIPGEGPVPDEKLSDVYEIEAQFVQVIE